MPGYYDVDADDGQFDYDDEEDPDEVLDEMLGGDRIRFADPDGRSALRAASEGNPRIHPCPSCGGQNRLTPADVARGYQCDSCADQMERGGY